MGRPNPQNLKVPTSEEARRNGAKGGKASGESRRKKKTMMEMLEVVMTAENEDPVMGRMLKKLGFEENDNYHMAKIITEVLTKAEKGDLKAVELLLRLLYGDTKNVSVNVDGSVDVGQKVHIYLPERDPEPE